MSATESPAVRASLAPVELPLLTLQLLTQLQYDRELVKSHYTSCKQQLIHQQERSAKEIARCHQTTEELQSDVTNLTTRAQDVAEAKVDLELQLQTATNQLKTAQERVNELEELIQQTDHNQETSERISQIWAGIQRVELSSAANQALLLQTKNHFTEVLLGEESKVENLEMLLARIQDLVEMMQKNSQLHEARAAAEQRVQELLRRVKALEDNAADRSNVIRTFAKYLNNLSFIRDRILKEHSEITAILKHHKSEIVRIEAELPRIFQNFTTANQKYKKELLKEKLKKILNGKYPEEVLLDIAKSGKVEDLSVLLQFDVDTEARDSSGKTALHLAAENGHLKACEMLLGAGSRIEAIATAFEGNTPLYIAAWKGHLDIVRLFAKRGANLSRKNRNGATPLKVAKVWNHQHVVTYLEQQGATE